MPITEADTDQEDYQTVLGTRTHSANVLSGVNSVSRISNPNEGVAVV